MGFAHLGFPACRPMKDSVDEEKGTATQPAATQPLRVMLALVDRNKNARTRNENPQAAGQS